MNGGVDVCKHPADEAVPEMISDRLALDRGRAVVWGACAKPS